MINLVKNIVLLCLLVGLAVWCRKRWNVWFHNAPEAPYRPLMEPGRVLLTLADDERSRFVTWQCDSVYRPSWLELAQLPDGDTLHIDAQGEVFASRSGRAAYYQVRLDSLAEATRYAYRVVTDGKASRWFSFEVHPSGDRPFAFLYIGDVQDTLQGETNRFLRQAVSRHPDCEFTLCGGDLVERPTDSYWGEAFRNIDSISQYMPFVTVTGNHDYFKGICQRIERRFDLVFPYFETTSTDDNRVQTLTYANAQIFLLDSERRPHKLWQQRKWLRQQLEQSQARWKILVLHHPLYSLKGSNNLVQRWLFDDLVRRYGVDLVLQGHEHAYARMTGHDDEGRATTPVYIVSHCSPKNYRIQFDERFDRFGISSRYYQTVETRDDVLILSAYDVYKHELYDSLRIVKTNATEPARIEDYGRDIPEYLEYVPRKGNSKDEKFAKRINARKANPAA